MYKCIYSWEAWLLLHRAIIEFVAPLHPNFKNVGHPKKERQKQFYFFEEFPDKCTESRRLIQGMLT